MSVGDWPIRRMELTDIPQVLTIERAAYGYPWSERIFRDCLQVGYRAWVVESARAIAGYALVTIAANEAHLLNICVATAMRHHGLGHQLLHTALATAQRERAEAMFLEVRPSNLPAIALYEQHGFQHIGRRPNYYRCADGHEDALLLSRAFPDR